MRAAFASFGIWIGLSLLGCAPAPEKGSDLNYSSGEHVLLGDSGFSQACKDRPELCQQPLMRKDGLQSFSYGELVAFSGDFYTSPEAIYEEQKEPFFKWHRNDVGDVKQLFQQEVETIEDFLHGHQEVDYPDFNLNFAWNYPDYLSISLANVSHFGFESMRTYVNYHQKALDIALAAHEKTKLSREAGLRLLNQALFINAFADHFLTDSFASGHIRNPRQQIRTWALKRGLNERTAGTLAKILHDRDGEIRVSGQHGLGVTNTRGDAWITRCDSQLFWNNSLDDDSIRLPAEAVALSLGEVLDAYRTGRGPQGVFAATELVPFPQLDQKSLSDTFAKDLSESTLSEIQNSLAFYARFKIFSGLARNILRDFLTDLPLIMAGYRSDVEQTLLAEPQLMAHLPEAYRSAFLQIQ